jgi:hypothetical protein
VAPFQISTPAADAPDLSIECDIVGMPFEAAAIVCLHRLRCGRRVFRAMMSGLSRKRRRRCHYHRDRDHKERPHVSPHFDPKMF